MNPTTVKCIRCGVAITYHGTAAPEKKPLCSTCTGAAKKMEGAKAALKKNIIAKKRQYGN